MSSNIVQVWAELHRQGFAPLGAPLPGRGDDWQLPLMAQPQPCSVCSHSPAPFTLLGPAGSVVAYCGLCAPHGRVYGDGT